MATFLFSGIDQLAAGKKSAKKINPSLRAVNNKGGIVSIPSFPTG